MTSVMPGVQKHVLDVAPDEHLFIVVQRGDRPTVSLDLHDVHGRGYLSVRVNGMGMGGMLVDIKELPGHNGELQRFCPYCGDAINLVSSVSHQCEPKKEKTPH